MKKSKWLLYSTAAFLILVYVIGEATGYLFFAMLIILPVGIWLLNRISSTE